MRCVPEPVCACQGAWEAPQRGWDTRRFLPHTRAQARVAPGPEESHHPRPPAPPSSPTSCSSRDSSPRPPCSLLAPVTRSQLGHQLRVLSSDTRSALSRRPPQGAGDERREETGWQRGCLLATGLWREEAAVPPHHRWTEFSCWSEPPSTSPNGLGTRCSWAGHTLSVPHVTPNLLSQSISLLLALQIFATTSSPPGSPSGCPRAGPGASPELPHCPSPHCALVTPSHHGPVTGLCP